MQSDVLIVMGLYIMLLTSLIFNRLTSTFADVFENQLANTNEESRIVTYHFIF